MYYAPPMHGQRRRALAAGAVALLALGRGAGVAAAGPYLTPTPAGAPAPTATPASNANASTDPTAQPTATGSAAAASVTPSPAATTAGAASADSFRDKENRLAILLDRARVSSGLLPLARSVELDRAAADHAQDMISLGYMDHYAPDGSTPGTRAQREGYSFPSGSGWMAIEAITASSDAPEGALGWLLSDSLHAGVVLRHTWRELGIAYAPGGPYGRFWVLEFGCRPNVLPPVLLDGTLSVPNEACSHAGTAFDGVSSMRFGDKADSAHGQAWAPYGARNPWPAGKPAVVDLQDDNGHQLEANASDPTGAPAEPASGS